jgi:hypothetical protein
MDWSRLQGIRLIGSHELREWIGDDGTRRYFRVNAGEGVPRDTIIVLMAGSEKALENQLNQWNIARRFDHANLVRVFATGYHEVEGRPVVYAIMERPEEDLASVTLSRALTVDETTEVARALIAALRYLHDNGFAHRKVDPLRIVAIGDSIKLLMHDAAPADPASIAADVQALGSTLCQLLSREPNGTLISSKALPPPFDAIVPGCTQRGWGLREVERALDGLPTEPKPIAVVDRPAAIADGRDEARVREEQDGPSGNHTMWIAGAGAAGALLAVLYLVSSGSTPSTQTAPPAAHVRQSVTTSPPAANAAVTRAAPAPAIPPTTEKADWRVIAYTYSTRQGAEEQTKRVMNRWPDLRPELFSPSGNSGPFLVSLGGLMTRSNAMKLRAKARANGLPRDTFARNFK